MRENGSEALANDGGGSCDAETTQKIAAAEVDVLQSYVRMTEAGLVLHEHVSCLEAVTGAAGCPSVIRLFSVIPLFKDTHSTQHWMPRRPEGFRKEVVPASNKTARISIGTLWIRWARMWPIP
jgi:hypothetical protein